MAALCHKHGWVDGKKPKMQERLPKEFHAMLDRLYARDSLEHYSAIERELVDVIVSAGAPYRQNGKRYFIVLTGRGATAWEALKSKLRKEKEAAEKK